MVTTVLFLGTAGDASVLNSSTRTGGGIIIRTGTSQVHLNPGPGALIRATQQRVDSREHTAVLLSSDSVLHSGGALGLLYALSYNGQSKSCVLGMPMIEGLDKEKTFVERCIIFVPDKRAAIEDIEIIATKTSQNELGYVLYTPETIIGYTGNTLFSKEISKQYERSDILILPIPYAEQTKKGLDISFDQARAFIAERDQRDTKRAHAPLIIPEGAQVIDNTDQSPQETLNAMLRMMKA